MPAIRAMIEYYRSSLIDLFIRVQAIQINPVTAHEECYAIQQILIQRIKYVEKKLQQSKTKIADLRKQLTVRQTKEKAQEIKNEVAYLYHCVDEYKNILYIYRSIGDALAFTYLSTWDIKPMTFKESPGFLSGKKGLREELRLLKNLYDNGIIAILNDLTNNLRYGDITAIVGEGDFKLIEVKSGKQREKSHAKQLGKMQKVETYLGKDIIDDLYSEGQQLIRVDIHTEEVYHRNRFNELLNQASERGSAYAEVEKGLVYIIDAAKDIDKIKSILQTVSSMLTSGVLFMLNTDKYNNRGYYPFPLSIQDPINAFDFYAGKITVVVLVDLQEIKNRLLPYNLTVEYLQKSEWSLKIIDIQNGKVINELSVGSHLFGRIAFDFLSLNWFLEEIIHKFLNLN